ncbi:hypothetical protein Tco_1317327 [Tanacetum coccineum]
MKRASKGYTRVDTPLFQTMLIQGQILQGEGSPILVESHHTPISAPSTSQPPTSPPSMQTTHVAEEAANMPHDSPLPEGRTPGSDEGRKQQNELMDLVIKLTDRVEVLENYLKQTKRVYGTAFTKLIKKVMGRKIAEIDEDPYISLVQQMIHHDAQTQGRKEHDLEPNFKFTTHEEVYTAELDICTANVPVSTAGAKVSTAIPEVSTAVESLVYIRRSATRRKDKEERQRIASVHEEASTFKPEEWDNIQAQIKAYKELDHELQAQERERYSEADKAKLLVELINERKRQFTQQRAKQRRNKHLTQAQQRSYMCNYIKHIESHTLQQLRGYSFDEIKVLYEAIVKRVNTFTTMESDDTVPKVVAGSSKRSSEEELGEESSKRQKIGEGLEPTKE